MAQDGTRVAHLQFVCVEDGRRGLGLGTALVRWSEVIGRESFGARKAEMEVDRENAGAIRLYERLGYAREADASAAARAWADNPLIRRMLGPRARAEIRQGHIRVGRGSRSGDIRGVTKARFLLRTTYMVLLVCPRQRGLRTPRRRS